MNRILVIAGVLIAVLATGWFVLRPRIRPANSSDAASTTQPAPQAAQQSTDQPKPPANETASNDQPSDSNQPVSPLPTASGDTINRNPQNGMIFAGAGKYQLYRQGDITWRLDTDTGFACVLFATDAQWSQSRVFDHGCASPQTVSR